MPQIRCVRRHRLTFGNWANLPELRWMSVRSRGNWCPARAGRRGRRATSQPASRKANHHGCQENHDHKDHHAEVDFDEEGSHQIRSGPESRRPESAGRNGTAVDRAQFLLSRTVNPKRLQSGESLRVRVLKPGVLSNPADWRSPLCGERTVVPRALTSRGVLSRESESFWRKNGPPQGKPAAHAYQVLFVRRPHWRTADLLVPGA